MAKEPKRIVVESGTELGGLLDKAIRGPLLLEKDGVTFRLSAESFSRRTRYDAKAAVTAMRKAAGSWTDIDPVAFKAFLYRAREEGTKTEQAR